MLYQYDDRVGQYRGSGGRFVSPAKIAVVVAETVDRLGDRLTGYADGMISDRLTIADFQYSVAQDLKDAHIQLGLLANGGGKIDKQVETELAEQFDRLDKFGQDIASGRLSVPQIKARARQYSNSARMSFYRIEALSKSRSGIKTAKRRLDSQAKHCASCLRYAGLGYVSLADLILPGTNCECTYGCKCSLVYRYY